MLRIGWSNVDTIVAHICETAIDANRSDAKNRMMPIDLHAFGIVECANSAANT